VTFFIAYIHALAFILHSHTAHIKSIDRRLRVFVIATCFIFVLYFQLYVIKDKQYANNVNRAT